MIIFQKLVHFALATRTFDWSENITKEDTTYLNYQNTIQPDHIDNLALIPFADMFNHHCCKGESHGSLNKETNEFQFITDSNYLKGEEVFFQYSKHSSAELLFHYGFFNIKTHNPYDVIRMELDDFHRVIDISEEHEEYIIAKGCNRNMKVDWTGCNWFVQKTAALIVAPLKDIESDAAEYMLDDVKKPENISKVERLLRNVIQKKIELMQAELDELAITGDEGFPEFITKALAEHYISLLAFTIEPEKILYDTFMSCQRKASK